MENSNNSTTSKNSKKKSSQNENSNNETEKNVNSNNESKKKETKNNELNDKETKKKESNNNETINNELNDKETKKKESNNNETQKKESSNNETKNKKKIDSKNKKTKNKETTNKESTNNESTNNESERKYPNKESELIESPFNVLTFKSWLRNFYKDKSLNKNDVNEINKIQNKKAQYALSVCDKIVCKSILTNISNKLTKSQSGINDMNYDTLYNNIMTTKYLSDTYAGILINYDRDIKYEDNLCISQEYLIKYIERDIFSNCNTIKFNNDVMNLINFILVKTNILLAETAFHCAYFKNQKSISYYAIITAVKINFKNKLLDDMLLSLDNVYKIVMLIKDDDEDDNKEDDNKEDDD